MSLALALSWAEVTREKVNDLVERQTIAGERLTLVRYLYQPGATFPLHAHPNEQLTMVEAGQLALALGDEPPVIVGAGQLLIIPPDVPHSARVVGERAVISLNVFAPARASHPAG